MNRVVFYSWQSGLPNSTNRGFIQIAPEKAARAIANEHKGVFMSRRYILTAYVHEALERAVYDKLEDQTFAGSIPDCPGVVAFAPTLHHCERELRSTLEDWILLGLKLAHALPVIGDIDLYEVATGQPASARHPFKC
jgi:predicted RNase H-like HicB family nuclease